MNTLQTVESIIKELDPKYIKCLMCGKYILKRTAYIIRGEGNQHDPICLSCNDKINKHCMKGIQGTIRCPDYQCKCSRCYSIYEWTQGEWRKRKVPLPIHSMS